MSQRIQAKSPLGLLTVVITGLLASVHTPAVSALVNPSCDGAVCQVWLQGEITTSTVDEVRSLRSGGRRIQRLNIAGSAGGDVEAAMSIGRMLREDLTNLSFDPFKTCASACVLLAAGPVARFNIRDGTLIVHSIYNPGRFKDYAEADAKLNAAYERISTYLKQMHVSAALVDLMKSVPADSSQALSAADAGRYGFVQIDAVWAEVAAGEQAQKLGITREELYHRVALRRQLCDPLDALADKMACLKRIGLIR